MSNLMPRTENLTTTCNFSTFSFRHVFNVLNASRAGLVQEWDLKRNNAHRKSIIIKRLIRITESC